MKTTLICLVLWLACAAAVIAAEKVSLIKIDGAIGPATASYISRRHDEAKAREFFGELHRSHRGQTPSQCRLGQIRGPRECVHQRGEGARVKSCRSYRCRSYGVAEATKRTSDRW